MITEERNPRTLDLDLQDTLEMVRRMNLEDQLVAPAVNEAISQIALAVDSIAQRLRAGGRLFYVGAGTSGRLGVLDAVECPPTFGVNPDLIQGVLAGGYTACHTAVEATEDDPKQGGADLRGRSLSAADAVVGLSASGRTPYTIGAVRYARSLGAFTAGISCNRRAALSESVDVAIEIEVGAEVIAGSTRMKAGTAQKMILNILSTAIMVRLGHVHSNLMVNLHLKNRKLKDRGIRIVAAAAETSHSAAEEALDEAGDVKAAIVMLKLGCSADEARRLIRNAGSVRRALNKR